MIEVEMTLIIFRIHHPTCCYPALSQYSLHCTALHEEARSVDEASIMPYQTVLLSGNAAFLLWKAFSALMTPGAILSGTVCPC